MAPWPAPQFLPRFSLLRSALLSARLCGAFARPTLQALICLLLWLYHHLHFSTYTSSTELKELDSKGQRGKRILFQSPTAKERPSFVPCSHKTPARCVQFWMVKSQLSFAYLYTCSVHKTYLTIILGLFFLNQLKTKSYEGLH